MLSNFERCLHAVIFLLYFIISAESHADLPASIHSRDYDSVPYISPADLGGNMFFQFLNSATKPEPLNVIITSTSNITQAGLGRNNSEIFLARGGLSQYLSALNFSDECLGLHRSTPALAAISSPQPQLLDFLYRENFGLGDSGSCLETVKGGFHFRGWRQNLTGAWLLGSSQEKNLKERHDLVPNGYDLGRNEVARRAALGGVDRLGCLWPPANVTDVQGLLQADAGGSVGKFNHDIGLDGLVKLIRVGNPICRNASSRKNTSTASSSRAPTIPSSSLPARPIAKSSSARRGGLQENHKPWSQYLILWFPISVTSMIILGT